MCVRVKRLQVSEHAPVSAWEVEYPAWHESDGVGGLFNGTCGGQPDAEVVRVPEGRHRVGRVYFPAHAQKQAALSGKERGERAKAAFRVGDGQGRDGEVLFERPQFCANAEPVDEHGSDL